MNVLEKAKDVYKKEIGEPPMKSFSGEDCGLAVYIESYTEEFIIWLATKLILNYKED